MTDSKVFLVILKCFWCTVLHVFPTSFLFCFVFLNSPQAVTFYKLLVVIWCGVCNWWLETGIRRLRAWCCLTPIYPVNKILVVELIRSVWESYWKLWSTKTILEDRRRSSTLVFVKVTLSGVVSVHPFRAHECLPQSSNSPSLNGFMGFVIALWSLSEAKIHGLQK